MLTKTGLGEALLATLGLYFCVSASSQLAGFAGGTEEVLSGELSLAFFSLLRGVGFVGSVACDISATPRDRTIRLGIWR